MLEGKRQACLEHGMKSVEKSGLEGLVEYFSNWNLIANRSLGFLSLHLA